MKLVQLGPNVAINPAHVVSIVRATGGCQVVLRDSPRAFETALEYDVVVAAVEKGLNS